MTGCSARQCKDSMLMENTYMSFFGCLRDALTHGGHDVDWRHVDLGESLKGLYDVAIIGLHALGSMASLNRKWGALWASWELPHIPMFQDWRVRDVCQQLQDPNYLWNCSYMNDRQYAKWEAAANLEGDGIELARQYWGLKMKIALVPVMRWGEPTSLKDMRRHLPHLGETLCWDPSPFFYRLGNPRPGIEKARRWVICSLVDQSDWFDKHWPWRDRLTAGCGWHVERIWPVGKKPKLTPIQEVPPGTPVQELADAIGYAGSTVVKWIKCGAPCDAAGLLAWRERRRKDEEGFVREETLVSDWFDTSWGIAMPYYLGDNAVRGWWRARFLLAGQSGCVLWADPREVDPLSSNYKLPIETIEDMSSISLRNLAASQDEEMRSWLPSKDESAAELTEHLSAKAVNAKEIMA